MMINKDYPNFCHWKCDLAKVIVLANVPFKTIVFPALVDKCIRFLFEFNFEVMFDTFV